MRELLDVVEEEYGSISHGQLTNGSGETLFQIGLRRPPLDRRFVSLVEDRFAVSIPLHAPHLVQAHRNRDSVQPCPECGVAAKGRNSIKSAHKGLLRYIPRELIISREAIRKPIHAIDVRVVHRAFGERVARHNTSYELFVGHPTRASVNRALSSAVVCPDHVRDSSTPLTQRPDRGLRDGRARLVGATPASPG